MTARPQELSLSEARALALRAQGLWDAKPSLRQARSNLPDLVRSLGAVQLDTISTLARSHQLVAHARLGALDRSEIEGAYWSGDGRPAHFEYWSHAACLLPIEDWPLFEFRREATRARGQRWHEVPQGMLAEVEAKVRAEGPLTSSEIGPSRKTNYWWSWSETKVALEWLLDIGVLVCVNRVGWKRQYDLAERVVPARLREPMSEVDALTTLLHRSLRVLGAATRDDLLDVHRLNHKTYTVARRAAWERFLACGDVVPVKVQGWSEPAYAAAAALQQLDRSRPKRRVLLSPFDSLIWFRPRMRRLFGMDHRLEAYTPAAKRQFGYFAMPVLMGDQLIARVDPNKEGGVLRAVRTTFESQRPSDAEVAAVAAALREAASWIGAHSVAVEHCDQAKDRLTQALAAS